MNRHRVHQLAVRVARRVMRPEYLLAWAAIALTVAASGLSSGDTSIAWFITATVPFAAASTYVLAARWPKWGETITLVPTIVPICVGVIASSGLGHPPTRRPGGWLVQTAAVSVTALIILWARHIDATRAKKATV